MPGLQDQAPKGGNETQLSQRQQENKVTWKKLAVQTGGWSGALLSSFYSIKIL